MSEERVVPRSWWQTGIIYQIYPRSFQDSNQDGIGDLSGIVARLDYLVELGVDAVWVSPFYPSPMADFGYDVADYTGVDPLFGTIADFDRLLQETHQRGLKLILDFVPNHSSDEHPWFVESRRSRDSPMRDWYLWRDAAPAVEGDFKPARERVPNNWMSQFGGPAWTWDEGTEQFYCHSFLPQQPDLNWRNAKLAGAIYAAMIFWLDKGVDGFRMDVLWLLIKDDQFRDNPPNPQWQTNGNSYASVLPVYTSDRPETHAIVAEMRMLLNSYADPISPGQPERVLIGEIYLPLEQLVSYYGAGPAVSMKLGAASPRVLVREIGQHLTGAQMPFNFHLIETPWRADEIARLILDYEAALPQGAWPNWVLGNHDQARLATRIGQAQARVAAMLLLTLRGTPTLYYGDELGMENGVIAPDQVRDPAEKNQPGLGLGRDPERTPMLWTDSSAADGFTAAGVRPWLPYSAGTPVSEQLSPESPRSLLRLYRRLIALRRHFPALHRGEIDWIASDSGVLGYRRISEGEQLYVLLNLTGEIQRVTCPRGTILCTTILDGDGAEMGGDGEENKLTLEANEGVLIHLK